MRVMRKSLLLMSAWSAGSQNRPRAGSIGVHELLSPETVLLAEPSAGKEALIAELVTRLCRGLSIADAQPLAAKVLEREKGISTTLDTGLSLPHARVDGLERIAAALAIPKAPLSAPAGEIPIRVIFLFFSPNRQEFFAAHLQLLREVSSLFQPALIERLGAAGSPTEVLALIREAEGAKAR